MTKVKHSIKVGYFGVLAMKTGGLLVVLAIVLAVLGAGLSYSGYNASLVVQTFTSIRSYTATSTENIASTRTETSIFTTEGTLSIMDQVIDIQGIKGTHWGGYYEWISTTLDAGKVNISYSSQGGGVDFWLFNENEFSQFQARHSVEAGVEYVVEELASPSYDVTANIPSSGTYYFVFQNTNQLPVSITLHVDGGVQTSVVTKTTEQVEYSTQVSPFVTETTSTSTQPTGFGPLFYLGIGLLVVAGVVLVIGRMRGSVSRPAQAPPVAPAAPKARAVSRPRAEKTPQKFCTNCGASLSAQAKFCNKCGTQQ